MKDLKCLFGLHKYEIHEEEFTNCPKGHVIGKTIISRCTHCGKIKYDFIPTINTHC